MPDTTYYADIEKRDRKQAKVGMPYLKGAETAREDFAAGKLWVHYKDRVTVFDLDTEPDLFVGISSALKVSNKWEEGGMLGYWYRKKFDIGGLLFKIVIGFAIVLALFIAGLLWSGFY